MLKRDGGERGAIWERQSPTPPPARFATEVFIVHGHDHATRDAVARFVQRIGLEPIILEEQPDAGLTVIEKFERDAAKVGGPRVAGERNNICVYTASWTLVMFTLEQINDAHHRLGNAATLAAYLRELNSIGVNSFTSYLCDGHSEFFGSGGYSLESPAAHEQLTVADASNRERFIEQLRLHGQQKTSYLEMSKGLADSGIEKWTMDTTALTVTYYDKAGNEMLVEKISVS